LEALGVDGELTFELLDLGGGVGVFLRQRVEIDLGGDGSGIGIAQLAPKGFILRSGSGNLRFQVGIARGGLRKRGGELSLPGMCGFELLVCGFQRAFVLRDRLLLEREFLLEGRALRRQHFGGLLEIVDTGGGPLEFTLRFLYLLVDGGQVAGEIVAVQR